MSRSIKATTWWIVFGAMFFAAVGAGALLALMGMTLAATLVFALFCLSAMGWLVYGVYLWNDQPWTRRFAAAAGATLLAALLFFLGRSMGWIGFSIAIAGIYVLGMAFVGALLLIRLIFRPGHPVFGVAHTLVDEAVRMKAPLVFIIVLVLFVPVLPLVLDPKELLHYRIQSFVTWSMAAVSVLLSLMTIFLAVGTITSEISHRQIYLTMTKPVSRGRYLLGKWLGVITLDLVLVAVCGGGVYVFTQLLARQPALSANDRAAVKQQVLTARRRVGPRPGEGVNLQGRFRQRLARLRASQPGVYGEPGSPVGTLSAGLRDKIQQQVLAQWFSIAPRGVTDYRFTGLSGAKARGATVQLRLKPQAGGPTPNGFLYVGLEVNGRDAGVRKLAAGVFHVLTLPADLISDRGVLDLQLHNVALVEPQHPNQAREQPSIIFNTRDGIELLYKVGGFEANFARSLAIIWLRLAALAMLGLMAGTYLGFPVACLLALLIYIAGAASGYLSHSLQDYALFPAANLSIWGQIAWFPGHLWDMAVNHGQVWRAIKVVIRLIGSLFLALIPRFGRYDATTLVADGRVVPNILLGSAALWIGIWTAVMALIAWLIFRSRELARVTV